MKLRWDPDKEQFPDNDAANKLLNRPPMRAPWKLDETMKTHSLHSAGILCSLAGFAGHACRARACESPEFFVLR